MTATTGGVFAVARSIWDHPKVAPSRPFDSFAAWLWLISKATWKAHRVAGVQLERGEFAYSVRFLATKWGWHRARVERFLGMLVRDGMIRPKAETAPRQERDTNRDGVKVYFICNYSDYQIVGLPKRDTSRDTPESDLIQNRDKEETLNTNTPFSKEKGRAPPLASPSKKSPRRCSEGAANLAVIDGGKADPWKEVFDFGKSFLGLSSGGQIAKLKKLYIDAPFVAMTKLHEAKTKTRPEAWLANLLYTAHDPEGRLDGEYIGDVNGEIA